MLSKLGGKFHHLGVACLDLDKESKPWVTLGYRPEAPDFEDTIQQVRGRFLIGAGPRLELLVATTPTSPVTAALARGANLSPGVQRSAIRREPCGAARPWL